MRRAIRHGKRLGLEKPFLAQVCGAVLAEMGAAYPETAGNEPFIRKVAQQEEESFRRTLDKGLLILEEEMARLGRAGQETVAGQVAFQLYDTYGFPMDLTRVIVSERGLSVDEAGFEHHMEQQRARSEWKGSGETAVGDLHKAIAAELGETRFVGYEAEATHSEVIALVVNGARATPGRARRPGRGDHRGDPVLRRVGRPGGRHRDDRRPARHRRGDRRAAAGAGPGDPPRQGGRGRAAGGRPGRADRRPGPP